MNEKEWAKILRVLANEKRLRIVKVLSRDKELPVFQIAERIGLSYKSTSRHLNRMAHLDILDPEGKGRSIEYRISSTLKPKIKRILKEILS
jgi:DNA-binding transcriptional ArsR family regulator